MNSNEKGAKPAVRQVEIIPAGRKESSVPRERLPGALKALRRRGKTRGRRLDLEKAFEIGEMIQKVGAWGGW